MDTNQTTLQSYEDNVQKYIDGTPQVVGGEIKAWIDRSLSMIKPGGRILELGSAFGRDAVYLESKGFSVERTDATKSFVELLISEGYNARILNAITDDFVGTYDMVFANAVLLHFTPDETERVLNKIHDSLLPKGVVAFTVKQGDGEGWTDAKLEAPRYFCYWQEKELRKVVEGAGFTIAELSTSSTRNADWLQVTAVK